MVEENSKHQERPMEKPQNMEKTILNSPNTRSFCRHLYSGRFEKTEKAICSG